MKRVLLILPSGEGIVKGIQDFLAGPSFDTAVILGAVAVAVIVIGRDVWKNGLRRD